MISYQQLCQKKSAVGVVGLGYVGLPLVVALARQFDVIGFDINSQRIEALLCGHDATNEVADSELASCTAVLTSNPAELARAGVIIIAVPTPVDSYHTPDLSMILDASFTVGQHMAKGTVVCYESTVYPGFTEEKCIPVLEKASGFRFADDFSVGYSPERINPGDKVHRLETIVKIVSGADEQTAALLESLYSSVVSAGVHKTSSIKVAEAAKVIENTQRDINIALMNELALIFDRMDIDTLEVLEAAGTKWNFLHFRPGLVGGHCIGVDPYYLTHKACELGYYPEVILSGRRINDTMGKFVAESCIKLLIRTGRIVKGARVGILGFTFKENVPDIRNTRVVDIIHELEAYEILPVVHDPQAHPADVLHEYGLCLSPLEDLQDLSALVLAVAHDHFKSYTVEHVLPMFGNNPPCLLDIKGLWDPKPFQEAGVSIWRL